MDVLNKLNGFKTYSGIIITVLGILMSKYVRPEEVPTIVDGIFQIIGILIIIIGAIHKDVKIVNLKKELE